MFNMSHLDCDREKIVEKVSLIYKKPALIHIAYCYGNIGHCALVIQG